MASKSIKKPKLRFPKFTSELRLFQLGNVIEEYSEKTKINNQYKVLTSSRKGLLAQEEYYGDSNRITQRENAGFNIIPNGFLTYRSRSDDGKFHFNINDTGDYAAISVYYPVFRCKSDNELYLLNLLNSNWKKLYKYSVGTSQKVLSFRDLKSIEFLFPEFEEQKEISTFFSKIDCFIDNLKKHKCELELYRKAVLQLFFTKKILFKDKEGRDFPDWELKKAGEIFANHTDKNHQGDLPLLAVTQDRGVIKRSDLDLRINTSEAGVKSYKIIDVGDFVISLRSFQGGIEYSNIRGISSPAYTVLRNKVPICHDFFRIYFKKESFIKQLNSMIYGIRDGKQISYSEFKNMKLPFPSLDEQKKIADFIKSLDELIVLKEKQIEMAEQWKKGLLQQMFV